MSFWRIVKSWLFLRRLSMKSSMTSSHYQSKSTHTCTSSSHSSLRLLTNIVHDFSWQGFPDLTSLRCSRRQFNRELDHGKQFVVKEPLLKQMRDLLTSFLQSLAFFATSFTWILIQFLSSPQERKKERGKEKSEMKAFEASFFEDGIASLSVFLSLSLPILLNCEWKGTASVIALIIIWSEELQSSKLQAVLLLI